MARSSSGESVLERAVRILEVFGPGTPAVSVTEIARRANLPLSTASRLVDDLVTLELLHRDGARQLSVGVRLWELASRASPTQFLRDTAMPVMEDLHARVRHHVQLGIRDGDEVLFIERLSAPGSVVNLSGVASRLPLHTSSSGLVLLAHLPHAMQEYALDRHLVAYSGSTITAAPRLRRYLSDVRRCGVAVCPGFVHADATGIAAPLRDRAGRVVAALSVVVPNDGGARSHVAALQAAARSITASIAYPMDAGETT